MIAVAVLIVTCPCALGLAVPAVQVIAAGRLMRAGVLLKSATALERLAAADTIVFDKTGTLTLGRPLLETPPTPGHEAALDLAASLAAASRHPLAKALAAARPGVAAASGVREVPGSGLVLETAAGEVRLGSRRWCGVEEGGEAPGPELWLARPGARPLRFAFTDRLREDAGPVAARLAAAGYRIEILSGDRPATVASVAAALGVEHWRAGLGPLEKTAELAAHSAAGRRVLMVGDGLNDAPALAAAFVSLSPATAADISQTAADAVFQGEDLAPVADCLAVARRAERLMRQSLALALAYNAVAVPLAIAGLVTPLIAAAAMSGSSLLVVGNALRLGGRR
jgi:Cu2+-exporting ATPase